MSWLLLLLFSAALLSPVLGLFAWINHASVGEVLSAPSFFRSLEVTLISGTGGAALSVLGGIFFARQFSRYEWRGMRRQRLLLLIPYLIPNFILASAYVTSWNPGTGLLNGLLRFPFGLYGLWGVTFLFAISHLPIAFLLLEDKMRRIDPSLLEAARLSGADARLIFFRIEAPLLKPTLISAFILAFGLNISSFAIPAWIGAPEHVYPLTYKVYQTLQVSGADGIPQAGVYSLLLFLLVVPSLCLGAWAARDEKKLGLITGKAGRRSEMKQRPHRAFAFQILFWLSQLFFWIAPLFCLFLSTLVAPGCLQRSGLTCLREPTLHAYTYVLFELAETRTAFSCSLIYGGLSGLLILFICLGTLVLLGRSRLKLQIAEWVFAIPVATPGAVIALGLIVTCSGRYGLNLYNTPWIVVAAMVIKHLNLAFLPLRTGLAGISSSLVEAARLSGANSWQVWKRIILPILKPEWMGGLFLVLIPILGELTMSIFLASPSYRSIGTVLFDLQDYADQTSAAALSILLVLLVLAFNQLARLLSRGKLGY